MQVSYVDLVAPHVALEAELLEAVQRVLHHGQYILGPEVGQFEKSFAELCGSKYAVGLNSGTDALILAMKVLDIGPGDEVITVANSFVATAGAVVLAGARPVFVDVGPDQNMDPARVESAITPRTKAILPVHLTGRMADMQALSEIARRHYLHVIEDAAQAVQAEHRGRRAGAWGTLGCFSLHPLKNLSACGDGGAVTTMDKTLYERLLWLRNIGLINRDEAVEWSGNSRLDTLQAALLLVKLRHLPEWTEKRRAHAQYYREHLLGIPGLELPEIRGHEFPVYHTFVVQTDRRDELRKFLSERNIATAVHYPIPIHLQKAAAGLGYRTGDLPVTERQAQRILSLPIYPDLNACNQQRVVESIRSFFGLSLGKAS